MLLLCPCPCPPFLAVMLAGLCATRSPAVWGGLSPSWCVAQALGFSPVSCCPSSEAGKAHSAGSGWRKQKARPLLCFTLAERRPAAMTCSYQMAFQVTATVFADLPSCAGTSAGSAAPGASRLCKALCSSAFAGRATFFSGHQWHQGKPWAAPVSAAAIAQQKGWRQEECWPGTDQAQQVTFELLWDLAWNVGDDLSIWAFAGYLIFPVKA